MVGEARLPSSYDGHREWSFQALNEVIEPNHLVGYQLVDDRFLFVRVGLSFVVVAWLHAQERQERPQSGYGRDEDDAARDGP